MKKGSSIYKCRLCGETYSNGFILVGNSPPVETLLKSVAGKIDGQSPALPMVTVHLCSGGSTGLSDLQGVRIEEEPR